jgi:hypothetical protein
MPERCLIERRVLQQMCFELGCVAIGLLIEWTISGHVKSRLWVFFVSDKQSDSVCYYMERGQKETTFEAHPDKVGFQDWVVSRWVGSTVNVVKVES